MTAGSKIAIATVTDLGLLVRAVRRSNRRPMDEVAARAKVGHVFVRDVEHGKDTVQLGRVLRVLQELNIPLEIAIPPEAAAELQRLRQTGLRPRKTRHPRAQGARTDLRRPE
jgi:transcriptional regulator with XRE-family HTH domain